MRRGGRPVAALATIAVGAVVLVAILAATDWGKGQAAPDQPVYVWFVDHRVPGLTPVLKLVTLLASEAVLPVIVLVALVVLVWRTRHLYGAVLLAGAMGLAVVIAEILKLGIDRHRPPVATMLGTIESNGSFPSFHTLGATTFVLVAGYLWWSGAPSGARLAGWLVGSALVLALVGASRLYLGFHWVSDVAASAAIAVLILGVVVLVDQVWGPRFAPGER